jgi:hypothetical protein
MQCWWIFDFETNCMCYSGHGILANLFLTFLKKKKKKKDVNHSLASLINDNY